MGAISMDIRTALLSDLEGIGCGLVQLTTDKKRNDAHRFYERLGFISSHEGMKLTLNGLKES
jgi:hypothetical protein